MPYALVFALLMSGVVDDDASAPPLLEASGPNDGGREAPQPVLETEDGECVTDEGLPAPCVDESAPVEKDTKKKKRTTRKRRGPKKDSTPDVRFVGMAGVLGGVTLSSNVAPEFGVSGSAGVLFKPGIGVVAIAHVHLNPTSMGVGQRYGVGAGVRFGRKSHFTLGLSPTLSIDTTGARFGGTVIAQVLVTVVSRFGLVLQPSVTFDARVVVFSATLGIGATF